MSRDNFKIEIPEIANTKMKLFVNDELDRKNEKKDIKYRLSM